jgi:putative ABC transport system permease protein
MRRSPGFYVTAVLMLALGIGINAAIFSVFSHVLLAPLRFADPDGLYIISSHAVSLGDARRAMSGPDFRDFRDENTVFSGVAAVIPRFSEPWTGDGPPRVVRCSAPTPQFFGVMGIKPVLGRLYTPEEYKSLHNTSVLISWNFWKREFNGDPHVIGRSIRIEDVSSTIVGVLPLMPDLYTDTDIWDKLTTEPSWEYMNWRANKFLDVVGRLKPGVSRSVAEQQLTSILRRAAGEPNDVQVQLTPLREFIVGPVTRQLNIIMAAVAIVLLVTCMNTAALLLCRAVKRSPELAVRLGLGASRARIRQQLLVEGLLLSSIGGVVGVGLASISVGLVRRVPGLALPRLEGLHLNVTALFASVAVVVLTSIVFAVLPASLLSRIDVASGLHGGRTETSKAQRRPFSVLIVAEIACAVVLTVCAGLLVRSFVRVRSVDLGFQAGKVLTGYLRTNYFGPGGYQFWSNVLGEVAAVPGATSAAASDCMPPNRVSAATIVFSDRPNDPNHAPASEGCWISPDFFSTVGSSLLRGRFFTNHDNDAAQPVAIINAKAAQQFFPGENPIGKRIGVNYIALGTVNAPRMREIVGIVSNLRQRGLETPSEPAVYLPYQQDETHHVLASMNLFVRSSGDDPGLLANSVREKIQSMYPNQPVERVMVMHDVVSISLTRRTYSVGLMTTFASLALLLCALGIYGVVSYVTLQRTREFGIRMALGATRRDVLRNVLQQGGTLIAAGVVFGIGLSLLTTRALSQLLFETVPFDPVIFASSAVMLGLIGILACLVPGVRASQLDPRSALNTE